ncbi:MAG TPA: cell envelope integrity protein TolA, partial [Myxococcota bacterium]|nr:cell envelope integrity protein TolA [Myxococcota bacterium]
KDDPEKAAREQAARDARMRDLLDGLAAEGPEDREAAGPVVDPSSKARSGIGDPSGSAVCTAWAKRVQLVLDQQFVVLPAYQGKGLSATLSVLFKADGHVHDASVSKSSGDGGYDASAVAAAKDVSSVPAPPSECVSGGLAALKVRYYKP